MLQITSYPTLSNETIAIHDSGMCCWCLSIGKPTIASWQNILDDGDDMIVITDAHSVKSDTNTLPHTEEVETLSSKIISVAGDYTVVSKRSYNKNITILLTFKNTGDDIGRVFSDGVMITESGTYKIVSYTRHFIPESGYYISNCVFDKILFKNF